MFEHQTRGDGQALLQNEQRTIVIDADGHGVKCGLLPLQGNVNRGAHAKKDALAAAAFVVRNGGSSRRDSRLQIRKRLELSDRFSPVSGSVYRSGLSFCGQWS
jgi:hypothetical protein